MQEARLYWALEIAHQGGITPIRKSILKQIHFHLIGICGTAMASLAGMLKSQGHRVTGSDKNVYPPMSLELERLGIPVETPFRAENLQPSPDVVVVGNAQSRGNPEVEYMLNAKLNYVSMPQVIKEHFIRGKHSIVVAGTHGKTSTTSLLAWTMETAGLNPSFLIGGVAENFGSSFRVTDSKYFVIEGDEYDTAYFDKGPKFMHYMPDTAILNNVEYDHTDIYPSLDAIKLAFRRFINLIPSNGTLVAGSDSPNVTEMLSAAFCPVESFATDSEARWQAADITYSPDGTAFTAIHDGKEFGNFKTPLAGRFNVRNCLAVIAVCHSLGVKTDAIAEGLKTFKSVKRRMEVRGVVNGVTVIDDFAHHPTAVKETLEGIKQKYVGKRIIAVYEPRSWASRNKAFQHDFESAFDPADYIVIAPIFEAFRIDESIRLNTTELVAAIAKRGKPAFEIDGAETIIAHLKPLLKSDDVVVIMSNGGFGGIHEKLLGALGT